MELQEIGSLSLLISKINGQSEQWKQQSGINGYLLKPLYALYLNPTMTQKQIGDCCSLPKQTVSNAIREMKQNGYVLLETAEEDRRERHIIITEKGRAYLDELVSPILAFETRVIARMGKDAYESLVYGLTKYAEAIELEAKE
ncbi:MAG: MarR family transcriptional regulator [Eubacteriales bacterium]|nr:MarR family transcriptional regulator [Eubacteriales bacterium]